MRKYVRMHACMDVRTYVCMCKYERICKCVCVCVCLGAAMHVYARMGVQMHTCMYVCTHAPLYVSTYYVGMIVCMDELKYIIARCEIQVHVDNKV